MIASGKSVPRTRGQLWLMRATFLLILAGGVVQWIGIVRQSVLIMLAAVAVFAAAIFTARRGLPLAPPVSSSRVGRFLGVILGSILLAGALLTLVVLILGRSGWFRAG